MLIFFITFNVAPCDADVVMYCFASVAEAAEVILWGEFAWCE